MCRVRRERRPVTDGGREVRPTLCFDVLTWHSLLKASITVCLYFYIYHSDFKLLRVVF